MSSLQEIEERAFLTYYPPDHLHAGVDSAEDLARMRGVIRQRQMLMAYAASKAAGEFPDGPRIRGLE